MHRRQFLVGAAATSAALLLPNRARAFGAFPDRAKDLLLPASSRVQSVLEIYLYGGLSPWETLYYVDRYGKDDGTFWYQYSTDVLGPDALDTNEGAMSSCGFGDDFFAPSFFAKDELGNDVMLGPFAGALRERQDLVDRLRVVVQRHDLLPHEAAVPFALTGKRVGQPSMAGLGAHIQQAFLDVDRAAGTTRKTPYSYVLASGGAIPSDNTAAFVAAGTHPGTARPLRINVDSAARLQQLLKRNGVGDKRDQHDALLDHYVAQYQQRLRHLGRGEPLRSPRFNELAQSARSLRNVDAIAEVMREDLLTAPLLNLCASDEMPNVPDQRLKLAAHLLTTASERARYVCVVDTGLVGASGGGGYDTHTDQAITTARNFTNVIRSLASIVNKPGERVEGKIDLDTTLVILNTEFGRTPTQQQEAGGRNHHTNGYVTALLGGPVPGRTLVGAIDDTAEATSFATPAENRMAALLALGIWPYANEGFVVSDHAEPVSEERGAEAVIERVLGVKL
jgi:hypothetical protein